MILDFRKGRVLLLITCFSFLCINPIIAQTVIKTVNVKDFGAKGDGKTDDYIAIQKACSSFDNVFFPKGKYLVSKYIKLRGGRKYTGDGSANTFIIQKTGEAPYGMGGAGMFYINSERTESFIKNNYISGITFEGEVSTLGHGQFTHLLALAGTENSTIENCVFNNFRGDGIFVSAALSYLVLPRDFRRNKNITIRNCKFNGGGSYKNRNGISVTDCDGITIDNCIFSNIGNFELSKSVGAIDFERDKEFSVIKNAVVKNCKFSGINQLNTSAITIMARGDSIGKVENFEFSNNIFRDCYWGIFVGCQIRLKDSETTWNDNVTITKNIFKNNFLSIYAEGKKVLIDRNKFYGTDKLPSTVNFGSRGVAYDITFTNNLMINTGRLGSINMDSVQKGIFANNEFLNNIGYSIFFFLETSQEESILASINFSNNNSTSSVPLYYFGHNFSKNKIVLNGSINDINNAVPNANYFAGEEQNFNGSLINANLEKLIPVGNWTDNSYIYFLKSRNKYKKTFHHSPIKNGKINAIDEIVR